jgi:FkbM family methyltransferase
MYMPFRKFLVATKHCVFHPYREIRRGWFRSYHARSKPHDIVCQNDGFTLKLCSNSVLAEPLYVGAGFEEAEIKILRKFTKPGMQVFDIGANVGLYTVILGKAVGSSGHVWSFEPFSPVAAYLRQNVAMNNLTNVTVVQKAVADTKGVLDFHIFPEGCDVYNSLGAKERPVEKLQFIRKVPVNVTTLDSFAAESGITKIDILKIDIEGAEERALSGAEQLLKNSPDVVIVMEIYGPSAAQCGCSSTCLVRMLNNWGFSMFEIDKNSEIQATDLDTFTGTNVLFKRK